MAVRSGTRQPRNGTFLPQHSPENRIGRAFPGSRLCRLNLPAGAFQLAPACWNSAHASINQLRHRDGTVGARVRQSTPILRTGPDCSPNRRHSVPAIMNRNSASQTIAADPAFADCLIRDARSEIATSGMQRYDFEGEPGFLVSASADRDAVRIHLARIPST